MCAPGCGEGKLRDQNRGLVSTSVTRVREGTLGSGGNLNVSSSRSLLCGRRRLSKYVAHVSTPLRVQWPCRDPSEARKLAIRQGSSSKRPGDPRFRPVARVLIRPFFYFPI
jgi:hypothetical protein